ncbi:hypothetical protein ETB97_008452 [Aspergillus alliaceus]|uniref:Uncharacterized protein n=1 Tax=Petromyces alliaceus TaxID=209559 RepID=A0A8H5ZU73_PETAA|nr:hypothetical protein ETB97_008452 [Aspergillus burnettii]
MASGGMAGCISGILSWCKRSESRFPVIITAYMTLQNTQELAGLSECPEVIWTTITEFMTADMIPKLTDLSSLPEVKWTTILPDIGCEAFDRLGKLRYCVVTSWSQVDSI